MASAPSLWGCALSNYEAALPEGLLAAPFVESSYRNGDLCFGESWSKKYFHFAPSGECYGEVEESSTACPSVKVFQAVVFTGYFL